MKDGATVYTNYSINVLNEVFEDTDKLQATACKWFLSVRKHKKQEVF
jgi:hypothetical protein